MRAPPAVTGIAARLLLGLALFVGAGWLSGELWISAIGTAEQEAMRQLAGDRIEMLVSIARIVTWAGSVYVLVPLAVACCLWLLRAGMRREALALAAGLAGAIVISNSVKVLTDRPRPPVEHLQAVSGSSFPSGHSTQASAFWLALALALASRPAVPQRSARVALLGALLLALAVAWSRVYLGVHFPSDVVAGLLLGAGWAVCVARLLYASRQRGL